MLQIKREADAMSMTNTIRSSVKSTIAGIGSTSGRAIMAVGKATIRAGERVAVEVKLRRAARAIWNTSVRVPVHVIEDILEYQRVGLYSDTVRNQAWRLIFGFMARVDFDWSIPVITQTMTHWYSSDISLLLQQMFASASCDWTFYPGRESTVLEAPPPLNRIGLSANFLYLISAILEHWPSETHQALTLTQFISILSQFLRSFYDAKKRASLLSSTLPIPHLRHSFILRAISLFLSTSPDEATNALSHPLEEISNVIGLEVLRMSEDKERAKTTITLVSALLLYYLDAEDDEADERWHTTAMAINSNSVLNKWEFDVVAISIAGMIPRISSSVTKVRFAHRLFDAIKSFDSQNSVISPLCRERVRPAHAICIRTIYHLLSSPSSQQIVLDLGSSSQTLEMFSLYASVPINDVVFHKMEEPRWPCTQPPASPALASYFYSSAMDVLTLLLQAFGDLPKGPRTNILCSTPLTSVVLFGKVYQGPEVLEGITFLSEVLTFCHSAASLEIAKSKLELPSLYSMIHISHGCLSVHGDMGVHLTSCIHSLRKYARNDSHLSDPSDLCQVSLPFLKMKRWLWDFAPRLKRSSRSKTSGKEGSNRDLRVVMVGIEMNLIGWLQRSSVGHESGATMHLLRRTCKQWTNDSMLFWLIGESSPSYRTQTLMEYIRDSSGQERKNVSAYFRSVLYSIKNLQDNRASECCYMLRTLHGQCNNNDGPLPSCNPVYQLLEFFDQLLDVDHGFVSSLASSRTGFKEIIEGTKNGSYVFLSSPKNCGVSLDSRTDQWTHPPGQDKTYRVRICEQITAKLDTHSNRTLNS